MEKRQQRTKNLNNIIKLPFFFFEIIFKFLTMGEIIKCLKINKTFHMYVKRLSFYEKYKQIHNNFKKLKNKYSLKDYIENDGKLIKSLIKKYKLTYNDSLLIFSEYINIILKDENKNDQKGSNQISLCDLNISSGLQYLGLALYNYKKINKFELNTNNFMNKSISFFGRSLSYNNSITNLSLKENKIGDKGCVLLFDSLVKSSIFQINLNNNEISHIGAYSIHEFLKVNKTLSILALSCNIIGDKGAEFLSDSLIINKTLKTLNISFNGITSDGSRHISTGLINNNNLQVLYYGGNYILSEGFKYLCNALKTNNSISYLFLDWTDIGESSVYLSDAIYLNTKISHLDLQNNNLGDKGIINIFNAIGLKTSITSLDIGNTGFTSVGLEAIVDVMKKNKTIIYLNLERNKLDKATLIAEMLANNKTLNQLNISKCNLRRGLIYISEGLKINNSLGILNIGANDISHEEIQPLINSLKVNNGLTALYIQDNKIGDKGLEILSEFVKINKKIVLLNLENNLITTKGCKPLIEAIKQNNLINNLDLGRNNIDKEIINQINIALNMNKNINN